jgi:hypothetical protein
MARKPVDQRYVGFAGIAAALLFGVGNALWAFDAPNPGAPSGEIVRFYSDTCGRIIAGASMSLIAIALFVFFASGVRRLLSELEGDDVLSTTAFGGAILGVAAGLGAETINMMAALRAQDGQLSNSLGQSAFEISQILGFNAAGVGIGVFAISTAAVSLRAGAILPRWLAYVTIVVGLALLTPLSRVVFGPAVLLLVAVASLMLRQPSRGPSQP